MAYSGFPDDQCLVEVITTVLLARHKTYLSLILHCVSICLILYIQITGPSCCKRDKPGKGISNGHVKNSPVGLVPSESGSAILAKGPARKKKSM